MSVTQNHGANYQKLNGNIKFKDTQNFKRLKSLHIFSNTQNEFLCMRFEPLREEKKGTYTLRSMNSFNRNMVMQVVVNGML